jgi:hypothetical protein
MGKRDDTVILAVNHQNRLLVAFDYFQIVKRIAYQKFRSQNFAAIDWTLVKVDMSIRAADGL